MVENVATIAARSRPSQRAQDRCLANVAKRRNRKYSAAIMTRQCHHVEARKIILSIAKLASSKSRLVKVAFRGPNRSVGNRDHATHWIHRYPAKMFHRIPQAILNPEVVKPRSVVLDPFCGSGTVLLEAMLAGYRSIGIDINPIARLISRVKTNPLEGHHLRHHFRRILEFTAKDLSLPPREPRLAFWFKPQVLIALWNLRRAIGRIRHEECRDFFLVNLSAIVRKASWADPSIAPPVKLTKQRAKRANSRYRRSLANAEALDHKIVLRLFIETVERNLQRVDNFRALCPKKQAVTLGGECHAADTGLPSRSVDVVLTSPPYCGAQKYVRSLSLEMRWLGLDNQQISEIDRRTLGTERTSTCEASIETPDPEANQLLDKIRRRNPTRAAMLSNYVRYLCAFVKECKRVLRPGGQAFVTFGTSHIAGYRVEMDKFFRSAARREGLKIVATIVDSIPSRGMITKRHRTAGCIRDERVVWVRKAK